MMLRYSSHPVLREVWATRSQWSILDRVAWSPYRLFYPREPGQRRAPDRPTRR
jgi:hypothetical protein